MKKTVFSIFASALLLSACNSPEKTTEQTQAVVETTTKTTTAPKPSLTNPTQIKGTLSGLEGSQKVFLDKKTVDATEIIANTSTDENGNFSFDFSVNEPGIYRLRVGINPIYIILEGKETVQLSATMNDRRLNDIEVTGSIHAEDMLQWQNERNTEKISKYIKSTTDNKTWLHLFLVERLDINTEIDAYTKVRDELTATYPNHVYIRYFAAKVNTTETRLNAQPVRMGQTAPEIDLPNPNGEKMKLSALKGKVVLLDFWASWCKPCRMANPHVVELYKKYKSKGFEVYSVSLDGIDDRSLGALQNDPARLEAAMALQRQRWTQAIDQDRLSWKNHVSDLRGWSSLVANQYGVNSIPRTFLIDKKGNVRFDNLRGMQLETKIKALLNE